MSSSRLSTRRLSLLIAVCLVPMAGGCSWFRGSKANEVKPEAFYQPGVSVGVSGGAGSGGAESGSVNAGTAETGRPARGEGVVGSGEGSASASGVGMGGAGSIAEQPLAPEVVTPPTPARPGRGGEGEAGSPERSGRTPARPVATVGTYLTVGGVLSEVNGIPIFATRVMRELEPVLSAMARELDEPRFRVEARKKIESQVREFEREELEVAAAQRNLTSEDKKLADMLTTDWRQKQIIAAGGSIEMARRSAAEAGENFDDQVKRENRRFLLRLYYQKRMFPRVAFTTNDMRRYYRDNVGALFTEHASVTFRLIRIDPARNGGKEAALEKIKGLREEAVSGADFGELASKHNDDAGLARRQGMAGTIAKGSLALQKVEETVFRTQPGQVTEIIEDRGGLYIAKVEAKQEGMVKPFEDSSVQETISSRLRETQITELREQAGAELMKNAIIRRDAKMMDTAMEMAMQRYPLWRAQ